MIVLDASAVVEMVRETPTGLGFKCLMMEGERAGSCDLLRAEAASVFRKLVRTEGAKPDVAQRYLAEAVALVDEFYPMDDLQSEALRESVRLDHSAYDMFYFVLARRTGGTLFTADRKLAELCLKNGVDCVAEFELPKLDGDEG
ncbi:MAG: type II toxin-antitoxin system VapC family toxin [Eggerthellaceae bacterium]|nr:type II toxin-antitoxin system VapC family toxin [Eggerthellaceae bacterium]